MDMAPQIKLAKDTLEIFVAAKIRGEAPIVDRPQIVAHATLSAFTQHWPDLADSDLLEVLSASIEIKETERSRWIVQRRIALVKLARELI